MAAVSEPPSSSVIPSVRPIKVAPPKHKKQPSFWLHFAAGGTAGAIGATILCPLEVVKTRLQSSLYQPMETRAKSLNPFRAALLSMTGVVDILRSIRQQEGIRALWKGLGPNLIGIIPARSIYFSAYSQGKHLYTHLNDGKETSIVHMASAATAGICTAVGTNPIWLIKTRMQLQSESKSLGNALPYKNSFHCAYMIVKNEGIGALYTGLSASFLGLAESTFQFVIYEKMKSYMKQIRKEQRSKQSGAESTGFSLSHETQDAVDTLATASIAKLVAAIIAYPHEVLRTRMRQPPINGVQKYTGLWKTAALVYREEGVRALYGGMTAHLMRVVPNAAIMFFCYEGIVKLFA
ncbi:mitochondrial carrier domain-containing protein [Polychytrium aggregatum]|uniref:mitochondrial carrier domain-containing protein n=1 Tax=Polychytrium aggregatum TaxID=110093 RepID=UPI0022FEEEA4|nr:mitochondrial carrier domain-containing protein [Polychytrium aggregatum]KAI9203973.1 mitochondrial carrier domain-containing protein [Polychytrium aggregatum]